MSDEEKEEEKPFAVERAKTGRAKCKKCKCPIEKDTVRIAKLVANPFSDGKMKAWHHLSCLFEVFAKQRATTKRIDDPEQDISGWEDLSDEDRSAVLHRIEEFENSSPFKTPKTKAASGTKKRKVTHDQSTKPDPSSNKKPKNSGRNDSVSSSEDVSDTSGSSKSPEKVRKPTRDDAFEVFQQLCNDVAKVDAYTDKTAIVRKMLTKGSSGDGFKSCVKLWCRLLLPGAVKRVYNLQSKQLLKLFSRILLQDEDEMLEHLEQGDVAETIRIFFEKSVAVKPAAKSVLTIQEVDEFLQELSLLTKEDEQIHHFRSIVRRCTADDLKMIIRLIKHDLRINAGPKHILGAVHDDAYEAFQTSRDLNSVIERCLEGSSKIGKPSSSPGQSSNTKVTLALMTPVLPMLAEACKSVEMAMKKCPNGMLSEIKYDGERVQVHKKGNEFRYFSRSLKPVLSHKVNLFKNYIPKAFPDGDDLILDSEILMIDTKTGQPLPFGSLGIHKRTEFKDANACLFIFDCIYYNGDILLHKPMMQRRRILRERMTEIPNRIMLSKVKEVYNSQDLADMIAKVLKMGLEGLVLKDIHSKYEPGKRHWLKVKKDYLYDGAMADSADLVVLGAWYGTGNKGGMMSVFLMGCFDEDHDKWLTVTKVHTGHDDATLVLLQDELDMVKIGKDPTKVPSWLHANKPMIPDFVAKDPKKQPVWEIAGAEFTNQGVHTADGISIRFPRVTRIRHDKDWSTATTLNELRHLFKKNSESIDVSLLLPSNSECKQEIDNKIIAKQSTSLDIGTISDQKLKSPLKKNNKLKIETSPLKKLHGKSEINTDCAVSSSSKKINKQKYNGEGTNISDQEDEGKAEFYTFIDKDYIEYTAAGIPLNWIEGRKPRNGLPSDAKPLHSLRSSELKANSILKGAPVSLASSFRKSKRKSVRKVLKTYPFTQ
ncbi:DNA ligase 3 [Eufriesea mexicana]|uniref:DNA ligase n=1 Tax=Eufriesea mexicana TaxID=516756 RepID=A0A310S4Q1_9HYME|nr:DNA ligase 3 [Eufriesea mexicana]